MTVKNRTKEEKNISKIVLLSSTIMIIIISFTLAFVLINLQIKEFKNHLLTFKNTLVQREKFTIKSTIQNLKKDILYKEKSDQQRSKQSIKNQVETAKRIALSIYFENRKINRKIMLNKIKKAIQNISISKEGIDYFIFDANGTCTLNTRFKKYEGENFIESKDYNGKKFIQDIINKSKTNNSFVKFLWYVPNSSKIKEKITYAKFIKGADIVIGSGKYIKNDDLIIKYLKDKLEKRKFSSDEFAFMYKIKSLSHIEKNSPLLLEKNIKTSTKTLNIVKNILIKSHYSGDMFYKSNEKLIYSTFLYDQRVFLAYGVNLSHINKIINDETKISNQNLNEKIISLVLIISFVTLIFFLFSYFVAKKIEKVFKDYRLKVINNERKYQLLFNHSNDGFIISKITNDRKAFIVSTNMLAKILTAYGVDLIGMDFFKLFNNFDKKTLFENGELLGKAVLLSKDKSKKNVELSCVLYTHNKETLLFSSIRDISERIQLKIEKQKQEKLLIQKSKMASMGEMIGNIAHQWRQPISQLSGLFFDIESAYDYGELNKKYLSDRIDEANDLVEYMSKTINDFKEFYDPNSVKEKFFIKENVKKTISIVSSSLKYHNIKIDVDINSNLSVIGYSSEFSQVLLNIISNSKEIALIRDVREPSISIYAITKDGKIFLHVEDNCGGIEDGLLDKIFEPYFTTKYNYGTGIGLYMSKIIIENKMGGKIYAQNTITKGARFTIIL